METTLHKRPKVRRHRLEGDHEDYCVRFPADDLAAASVIAERRGIALAEVVRRAVKLFNATDMHMDHEHVENGHE